MAEIICKPAGGRSGKKLVTALRQNLIEAGLISCLTVKNLTLTIKVDLLRNSALTEGVDPKLVEALLKIETSEEALTWFQNYLSLTGKKWQIAKKAVSIHVKRK